MKISDVCEHEVSKAELCRLCGSATFASPVAQPEAEPADVDAERQAAAIVTIWHAVKDHDDKLLVRYIKQALMELKGEVEREQKDHQLTIDTFRQQERIWQQKNEEVAADARADAIGECVKVAASHKHVSACDGIGCKQVIAAALARLHCDDDTESERSR